MDLASYGITKRLNIPYGQAVEMVRAALKEEGFGVLTEIDVKSTIKEKLGQEFRDYIILGACNPPLAHRALSADPMVGLLLPCNVIVYDEDGISVVSAMDPVSMMRDVPNEALQEVARDVRPRLERAVARIASQAEE